jgi:hypothetical protein
MPYTSTSSFAFFPLQLADLADRKCSSMIRQAQPYIRDPRIIWCDSANVGLMGIYTSISISCRISRIGMMEWMEDNILAWS